MKHHQITASMAKDIAFKLGAVLDDEEAGIFADGYNVALLQSKYRDLSQPVDPQISEYEKIMGQAGNSPVTPDDWIPVSERMPPQGVPLLVCSGNGVVQRTVYGFDGENWLDWYEQYDPVKAELDDLWQPLPAPPQK
ncbi:DUF551 domain-containing protein [Salmonella enterica]|nr:DUF551 domain-containing protein [Salmonella enterica]ECP0727422.1 DUF551 domain-containing protein [Salmonella enterica]EJX3080142.1 DUF551 domain-containing protein [Salmonella enterica]EJX3248112.1 DUF551 domain-containing protein [Salmonella enterica]EJX3458162.1 DUF551 domain-containing protein [Salmonella enterica]